MNTRYLIPCSLLVLACAKTPQTTEAPTDPAPEAEAASAAFSPANLEEYAKASKFEGESQPLDMSSAVSLNDMNRMQSVAMAYTSFRAQPPNRGATAQAVFADSVEAVVMVATELSMGSGAVMTEDGFVITNWHVVQNFATVAVMTYPGESGNEGETFEADVVRIDPSRDLALLKIRSDDSFSYLNVAPSDPGVGADVHAIGHPRGQYWTYTNGVVSQVRPGFEWNQRHKAKVIQTQTPINPGNSGGPLLSDDGSIIGINSFGRTDSPGLNYAVAASEIMAFAQGADPTYEPVNPTVDYQITPWDDTNGDGTVDVWAVDWSGNGVVDCWVVDNNFDVLPDIWYYDMDENGKTEAWAEDTNNDQIPDSFLIDENDDLVPDVVGIDVDGDGFPDRFGEYVPE